MRPGIIVAIGLLLLLLLLLLSFETKTIWRRFFCDWRRGGRVKQTRRASVVVPFYDAFLFFPMRPRQWRGGGGGGADVEAVAVESDG